MSSNAPSLTDSLVKFAGSFLGTPYVWGGASPQGFDCSGLVQYVYQHFGINLPRTAQQQYVSTQRVSADKLQPGDLVFFSGTDPQDPGPITHVGIYLGNNQFENAPNVGENVTISNLTNPYWASHFAGGGRVLGLNAGIPPASTPVGVVTQPAQQAQQAVTATAQSGINTIQSSLSSIPAAITAASQTAAAGINDAISFLRWAGQPSLWLRFGLGVLGVVLLTIGAIFFGLSFKPNAPAPGIVKDVIAAAA